MLSNPRHRTVTLAVLAVAIVGLVLVVLPTDDADAALPSWVNRDSIVSACNAAKNFPMALLGVGNGAVAAPSAQGALPKPGASVGGRATYYNMPVTANEAVRMAYNPANSPYQQATALRQALWGSGPSAGATTAVANVPVRVVGATASVPIATPGAAVAASGTATATTSTAVVTGAPAATTVTSASATMSGSTVAVAAATAVGSFCGTTLMLDWAFGEDPASPPATSWQIERMPECDGFTNEFAGASTDDICWLIDWDGTLANAGNYGNFPRMATYADQTNQGPVLRTNPFSNSIGLGGPILAEVVEDGTVRPGTYTDHRDIPNALIREPLPGRTGLVMPCAEPTYACGLFDQGPNSVSQTLTSRIRNKQFLNCPVNCFLTTPMDDDWAALGKLRRLAGFTQCQTPAGDIEEYLTFSDPFWDSMGKVRYEAPNCPIGYAPTGRLVVRQKATGGSTGPVQWPSVWAAGDVVLEWELPDDVRQNPTTLACLVVGATDCPRYDPDPSDPNNDVNIGGPDGEPAPPEAPTVDDGVDTIIINLPELPDDPDDLPDDPGTNPTPTTTPSTTPTTTPGGDGSPPTTIPNDTSVPPSDPPPPPDPPDPSDNQWSNCMEEQVDSDWSEVTFNPVTWVRAIIYYVTAPIICALWWLVVPPGGFDSLIDTFEAYFGESEVATLFTDLMGGVTWNSGCAPVDFGDPMEGWGPELGAIDVGMCGNPVVATVWVVLLALAVISMAGSLVRTLWTFGQYEKVGYI